MYFQDRVCQTLMGSLIKLKICLEVDEVHPYNEKMKYILAKLFFFYSIGTK